MRRKFLTMCLLGIIAVSILSGCGSKNKTETEPSTDAVAETKDEAAPVVVEEPEVVVPEVTEETVADKDVAVSENVVESPAPVTKEFDWGLATISYPNEDKTMSHNVIQYTNDDEKIMNFTFDSNQNLLDGQYEKDNNLYLSNDSSFLQVWYGGELADESTYLKNAPKDIIVSLIPAATYPENGYYNEDITDVYHKIIFAVQGKEGDVETKGYACYIDNYDLFQCYQFAYFEPADSYDDARALAIVNSISAVR